MAISDADGYISYVNPAFLSLWGFRSADEVTGRGTDELWGYGTGKKRRMQISGFDQAWSGMMTGFQKDGSTIRFYGMLSPVRDADGTVVGIAGLFMDKIPVDRGPDECPVQF